MSQNLMFKSATSFPSSELRALFGVSSIGLGHARRSLAVANELRIAKPDLVLDWVCAEPALSFLKSRGQNVLSVSTKLQSLSLAMERSSNHGRINDMGKVARVSSNIARQNYSLIKPYLKEYDVLVQDEFVETAFSFIYEKKPALPQKRVIITDYISFKSNSLSPVSRLVIWMANRYAKRAWMENQTRIFADELDSLAARESDWIKENFEIVGPIVAELPMEPKEKIRERLFTNSKRKNVVVFTVGGTSIGGDLIDFVVTDSVALSRDLDALIVVMLGPRVAGKAQTDMQEGLLMIGFTPDAMDYFKSADCVVAQAGASTLNEVSALGVSCVSVPIANHFEQEDNARRFQQRFGFPILHFADLNHENLVSAIKEAMAQKYVPVCTSGAKKAAELILNIL